MSKPSHSPGRLAWKSACSACRATFDCLYSIAVILLICLTAFVAYVAALEAIPVPGFIIREARDQLKTKGLTLRMDAIRFQPNGRVLIVRPQLYSPELGSTVFTADKAVAKIKIPRLMLGRVTLDELRLSNGRLIIPAMLTPSGEPTIAIDNIGFEAELLGERWLLRYATIAIDHLKVAAAGSIKDDYFRLQTKRAPDQRLSISALLVEYAPKIAQLQRELKRFDQPVCLIDLRVNRAGRQEAAIRAEAARATLFAEGVAEDLRLELLYSDAPGLRLLAQAEALSLPQATTAAQVALEARWQQLPDAQSLMPNRIELSAATLRHRDVTIPSFIARIDPAGPQQLAELELSLPDAPTTLQLRRDTTNGLLAFDLLAQIDPALPAALAPLARQLAGLELEQMATLGHAVDLHARGQLNSDFKPVDVLATAQTGPAVVLGAAVDRARGKARARGPQIDVENIRIQSGPQQAELAIGYNLDTRLRRIQVEGQVDPTLINGWFKPWWAAMWEGMSFPESGLYAALDSQATFKKPETVRVTGIAHAENMNLRGLEVSDLRTRFFSRFHYVDLYDIELATRDGGEASGNVQFSLGRDLRDEKDKLTGLWIDVDSTLDVMKGPEVIWELRESISEILAPYRYQTPPRIAARSSSLRRQDVYQYDIDLDIDTPNTFAYHDFPLDSLSTSVHLRNGLVDLPNALAGLGGGVFEASAFIRGEDIEIDAVLVDANFEQVLQATNAYFAANQSEAASPEAGRVMNFGGVANASFSGAGLVGDTLSYTGAGDLSVSGADFGKFQLFGLLSMALEATPLGFTTLKFDRVAGPFSVDRDRIQFHDIAMDGPVASIRADGSYFIPTEALDFRAKLFPFRNSRVPFIAPLLNIPLNIVSHVFEVSVTGTLADPRLRLFNPSTREAIDVDKSAAERQHRPPPR